MNVKTLDRLRIGTGEFFFSPGAATPAAAQAAGYIDFGNIVAFQPRTESQKNEHRGSYEGITRIDKTIESEQKLTYVLRADEWDEQKLLIAFKGTAGTAFTQSALVAADGSDLLFGTTPAVIGRWYNLLDIAGAQARNLTAVTIATLTENTDFVVAHKEGMIRFLTAQSADLTPVLTAPAVVAGEDANLKLITPLSGSSKTGIGRLKAFDDNHGNKLVMDHVGFACEITADEIQEFDGSTFSQITLNVLVTDPIGSLYIAD